MWMPSIHGFRQTRDHKLGLIWAASRIKTHFRSTTTQRRSAHVNPHRQRQTPMSGHASTWETGRLRLQAAPTAQLEESALPEQQLASAAQADQSSVKDDHRPARPARLAQGFATKGPTPIKCASKQHKEHVHTVGVCLAGSDWWCAPPWSFQLQEFPVSLGERARDHAHHARQHKRH